MKASCGNGLRGIAVLALLLRVACASAQSQTVAAAHPATPADAQAPQNAPQNRAPMVVVVRIVNESGKILPEPSGGLPIQVHEPLNRAQVAETLRVLFRTGDYADVRAVESPADGGVRIDFVVARRIESIVAAVQRRLQTSCLIERFRPQRICQELRTGWIIRKSDGHFFEVLARGLVVEIEQRFRTGDAESLEFRPFGIGEPCLKTNLRKSTARRRGEND